MANQNTRKLVAEDKTTHQLVAALCKRGLSATAATSLIARHNPTAIKQAVRAMDEQLQSGSKIRAADRWLTAALKNGYQASPTAEQSALRPERQVYRARNNMPINE